MWPLFTPLTPYHSHSPPVLPFVTICSASHSVSPTFLSMKLPVPITDPSIHILNSSYLQLFLPFSLFLLFLFSLSCLSYHRSHLLPLTGPAQSIFSLLLSPFLHLLLLHLPFLHHPRGIGAHDSLTGVDSVINIMLTAAIRVVMPGQFPLFPPPSSHLVPLAPQNTYNFFTISL